MYETYPGIGQFNNGTGAATLSSLQNQLGNMQQALAPLQGYFGQGESGDQLKKVNGIESAKAYQTKPNSRVVLFDMNEDIFYIKTTDSSNFPSIRTFKFEEITEEPKQVQYVTMDEFNKFKEDVLNGQQLIWSSNTAKHARESNAEPPFGTKTSNE